jgi:beta-propeller repeat-containing protein
MRESARIQSRNTFTSLVFLANLAAPAIAATATHPSESYGKLPLQFEANRGQTAKEVQFLSRGPGYSLYLTSGEAVLVLSKSGADAKRVALRMSLVGAARKPVVSGLEELPGKANYFIGKDRSKWRTNVPTYAKVHYRKVYPGIDLVYYGNQRELEYDFVVAPGADPKKIVLGFKGADKLEIDAQGDLVLHATGGEIRQHKPILYQEIDGVRQVISGGYVRRSANRVGFKVAAYDTTRPLVIDPVVLSYSTYLGSSGSDGGAGIAVDTGGNAYVTGSTSSIDFPITAGASQASASGTSDAFVTKLNPDGSALIYSTYLGGSGSDGAAGIVVDAAGAAYLTGGTDSIDFPTTAGAFQATFAGGGAFGGDAFVAKLDPTGSALVYSTYLGGSGSDGGAGIAVDAGGNAYVTGLTTSPNIPTTAGAFQRAFASTDAFNADAFVAKLDPRGCTLVYSTYLGGSSFDSGTAIALDAAGNAYVTGSTQSSNFPTTAGSFQAASVSVNTFNSDAFVTKLDPGGSALIYSTYLGGGSDDGGFGIAVDATGAAYVIGRTNSFDFPATAGAVQPVSTNSLYDAFVTKLVPAGSALAYSARLGGGANDVGSGIAVDADGNAYVIGATFSDNFPTTPGAFQPLHVGGWDVFFAKIHPSGSLLLYSTYLGGSGPVPQHGDGQDQGQGIAVDSAGSAYLTGYTVSSNFPTTPGVFQPALASPSDAFVAKFAEIALPPPPTPTGSGPTRSEESAATQIGFWTGYGAETGTFSGGSIVASNVIASTAMFSFTGTAVSWIGVKCNVCGIALVSIDGGAPTTVNTAGPNAPGSLSSESVFSASGLAAANHTLTIAVTGMSSSGGSYVAVDAFDVTAGNASSAPLPSVVLPPPVTLPPLPPLL